MKFKQHRTIPESETIKSYTISKKIGKFRQFLQYKMDRKGEYVVYIDKWYPSSKTCHHYRYINKWLQFSDQEWVCPQCSTNIIRDWNAALNIKDEGIRTLLAS